MEIQNGHKPVESSKLSKKPKSSPRRPPVDMDNSYSKTSKAYFDQKLWYLEYSPEQKCFHVDTMDRIIENNVYGCLRGDPADYYIISGPHPHDDAFKAIKYWLSKLPYEDPIFGDGFKCR